MSLDHWTDRRPLVVRTATACPSHELKLVLAVRLRNNLPIMVRISRRCYLLLKFLERGETRGLDLENIGFSIAPEREPCGWKFRGQLVVVIPVPRRWLKSEE